MAKVSATNEVGSTDAFTEPTEPVVGTGGDTDAPVLTNVSVAPKRFGAAARAKPHRTTLRFTSNEAGTISVAIYRLKAKKPTATLTQPIAAGKGHLALSARIGKKRLRPGRYVLSVTESDAAGNISAPVRRALAILAG